jgi:MSHA biogenesis protein MshO
MKARGFTLIELVVSIAISAIVVVFAAMFIGAPLGAYEAHSRRAVLVADASGAWPRMAEDLRLALPNSLRTRRNGNFVVIELLKVADVVRYVPPTTAPFNTAGVFRVATLDFDSNFEPTPYYLSVNNTGPGLGGVDAYTLAGSMTPAGTRIEIDAGVTGEALVTVTPAAAFTADSPRFRLYLVSGPVTYLCDEVQGTLVRYENYTIAPLLTARDSPAELNAAGPAGELITRGLTGCNFAVSAVLAQGGPQPQTASVTLTTTRNGDSVTLLHSAHSEYQP